MRRKEMGMKKSIAAACTTHLSWADLQVQGRYRAYGVMYYTSNVTSDDMACVYLFRTFDQHKSQW
jgi:hypothetical protein